MPHLPFESAARRKVILIYIISLCMLIGSVWAFIAQFHKIQERKEMSAVQQDVIRLSARLIETVRLTHEPSQITDLHLIMDSIEDRLGDLPSKHALRDALSKLSSHKDELTQLLNQRLNPQKALLSVSDAIHRYSQRNANDSLRVRVKIHDSSFSIRTPETFWKRLAVAFKPKVKLDTIWQYNDYQTDTQVFVGASPEQMTAIKDHSDQALENWITELQNFELDLSENFKQYSYLPPQLALYFLNIQEKTLQAIEQEMTRDKHWFQQQIATSLILFLTLWIAIAILTLWALKDIRKSQTMRQATERAEARTREIMLTRQQIMLSIAHDIKTPLSSILGYLDLWKHQPNRRIPENDIRSVYVSGQYIHGMVQTLLSAAAIEQGKLRIENRIFDLNDLCSDIQALFMPLSQSKGLDFKVQTVGSNLMYSDANKIKTVAINLISNAIKYTPHGFVAAEFIYSSDQKQLLLNVSDSGIGMDPSQIQKLFMAFQREQIGLRLAEGNGLGLFVVKGICSLMNATINIDSHPDHGTRIGVCFPMGDLPTESTLDVSFSPKKILIIEDDPLLLSLMTKMIQLCGHQCQSCLTFSDFQILWQQDPSYDWIITDWDLGDKHLGSEVLCASRQFSPNTRVAILSGIDRQADLENCHEQANAILSKPLNFKQIKQLLGSRILDKSNTISFPLLSEVLGNDPEAINAVLIEFSRSIETHIAHVSALIEQQAIAEIPPCVHRLKGMFAQLGAKDLCNLIQDIESWDLDKLPETWETCLHELIWETLRFQNQLQDYLQSEASTIS